MGFNVTSGEMQILCFVLVYGIILLIMHLLGFDEDKLKQKFRNWRLARQTLAHVEPAVEVARQTLAHVEQIVEVARQTLAHVEQTVEVARQTLPHVDPTTVEVARQTSTHEEPTVDEPDEPYSNVPVTLLPDSDVLDCPICYKPLKIPIFQCNNGHLACSQCRERINNKCPSCRLPIESGNRCRAMEKVIEAAKVSCRNAIYGCKELVAYANPSNHKNLCLFRPDLCFCPMSDCNYNGSSKNVKNHLRAGHKNDLIQFKWNTTFDFYLDVKNKTMAVFQEKEGRDVIVVQGFSGSQGLSFTVSCIAPLEPRLRGFYCSLKLGAKDIILKHELIVRNVRKVSDQHPEDDFVLIPRYMLPSNDRLKMKICIRPSGNHLTTANA